MNTIRSLSMDADKQGSRILYRCMQKEYCRNLTTCRHTKGGKGERGKKQREGARERGGRGKIEMLRYLDIFTFSREGFLLKLFFSFGLHTQSQCAQFSDISV